MEVDELQSALDPYLGQEIDLPSVLDRCVGNVINLTLFNKRFQKGQRDEFAHLKSLIDGMRDITSEFRYFIQYLVPWTSKVIPGPTLAETVKEKRALLDQFFNEQIEEHRKTIDFEQVENSDFVEAYLKEQRKRERDGDIETFCNKQLTAMCFDLWIAGHLTTTMTLTRFLTAIAVNNLLVSYYLHNPDVKKKIQIELGVVIGESRLITTADKNNLPYISAFLAETQRCANIIPLNLMHMTTRDTVIDGFEIPKATGVIAQISTVMTDEKVFPDPYCFNPERFIDENGKFKKCEQVIPFSIGKRQCLGEGLARMELFLFFANLFHRYDISPGKEGLPCLDKSKDNFVLPRKFNAVLVRRHS
uniref:Cytochrome P450 n=1 Tax=Caenorhabditis japonica TaxID=281687 RepID=A0A8R1DLN8_CAEJA